MKIQEFQNRLEQENLNLNIEMSEKIAKTPIAASDEFIRSSNEFISSEKKRFNFLRLTVCFVCFVFMAICVSSLIIQTSSKDETVGLTSYILEINPSICITTDKNDSVINICALNDDANIIVSDESVKNFKKLSFDECVARLMGVIRREGYFDDFDIHDRTIKLYAFNDSNETQYKRLKHFEKIMQDKMNEFGYNDVPFEKHRIGMDDFKKIMGFEEDFETLDDMDTYFKQKNITFPMPPQQ